MSECPNIHEPSGCWRVRCQLGKKCVEPEQITNEQREAIVRNAVAERDAALSLLTAGYRSYSTPRGIVGVPCLSITRP